MRKFLGKFGKKTRILVFTLLFVSAFATAGYKLLTRENSVEALTQNGDSIAVSGLGDRMTYGNSNWSTRRYTAANTTRGTSATAMCADATKSSPAGLYGTAYELSSSTWGYQDMVNTLLVTVPEFNPTVYNAFYNANALGDSENESWSTFLAGISEIPQTGADGVFVAGHVRVSGLYTRYYDFVSTETSAKMNMMGQNIYDWMYSNGYGDLYTQYKLYYATAFNGTNIQDIVWLEYSPTPTNGYAQVVKYDSSTGGTISGGTYALYSSTSGATNDGSYITSVTSGVSVSVSAGWYCFVETAQPSGYLLDSEPHCAYVTADQTTYIPIYNTPEPRGGVRIMKVDSETNSTSGQGVASIDGAQFGIYRTTDNALMGTLTISGGYAESSSKLLKAGNYYVQEIAAGTGYITNSSTRKSFTIPTDGGMVSLVSDPFTNQIIRGGLTLTKTHEIYGGGTEAFAGVTFNVTNNSTNETVQITTDSNGVASTASNALIYGTYTVSEVAGTVNEAFSTVAPFTVNITSNGTIVNVGTKNNEFKDDPSFSTIARNATSSAASPEKEIEISLNANIVDRIIYDNTLTSGLSYKIVGELYEVSSRTLIDTEEVIFTKSSETEQEMTFLNINTADFIGKTLGIVQTLYVRNNGTWYKLYVHNSDLSDTNERVKVKDVQINSTTANSERSADNKKLAVGKVTVIDTVEIIGLVNGQSYTLTAELRDASGNAIMLSNGATSVTETYNMVATTGSTISTTVELEFESSNYIGQTITVYETLKNSAGTEIAYHRDLTDTDQQVQVLTPTIGTTAVNNGSGDDTKKLNVGNTSVKDTVSYTGLVAGNVYTIDGKLVNKATGDVVQTGTVSFTASGETGTVEMTFSVDTNLLFDYTSSEQAKLVVFEYLKRNELEIAKHENLEDAGQTVQITVPTIRTSAVNKLDNTQKLGVGDMTVKDTITYSGLVEGDWYMVVGTLIDKATGEILELNNEYARNSTTFRAGTNGEGTVVVEINLDTTTIQGKELVAFERLYRSEDKHGDGRVLAVHEDLNDEAQTVQVKVARIATTALDGTGDNPDGDNVIEPEEDQTIVDTVEYEGLMREETYTLVGALMNKETEEPLLINGEEVTASTTFTTSERRDDGAATVTFTFDASELPGGEIVVFERLYRGENPSESDTPVTVHEDIEDANQYIRIKARIGTAAVDDYDGDQKVGVGNVTIVDTVEYEGLKTGKTYVMRGTLVDKETGEEIGATAEKRFTVASDSERNGTVTMTFEFSTVEYIGKDLVVFEELYLIEGTTETFETEHKDLEDESQTVSVLTPRLVTTAVDKIDLDKELAASGIVVVQDMVEYSGLVAGTDYVVRGILKDRATGETFVPEHTENSFVEQELEFTARGETGTVTLDFQIDVTGMSGHEIVVFEDLYVVETFEAEGEDGESEEVQQETQIAAHDDINDQMQTVWVRVISPETGLFTKQIEGARARGTFAALGAVIIASFGGFFGYRATKKRKFGF